MALKYQNEIDNLKLEISCPSESFETQNEIEAYRWTFDPINHQHNFLPNIVFDRVTNSTVNYSKKMPLVKCNRCGASFFTSLESAKTAFGVVNGRLSDVLKLTYTHIAKGTLNKSDGLMKKPDQHGHFGFYEYEKSNLVEKFKNISTIE